MLVKWVAGYISGSIVPMFFSVSCSNVCSCNLPQLVPILHGSCQIVEGSTCSLAHFATVSDVKEGRPRQLYIYREQPTSNKPWTQEKQIRHVFGGLYVFILTVFIAICKVRDQINLTFKIHFQCTFCWKYCTNNAVLCRPFYQLYTYLVIWFVSALLHLCSRFIHSEDSKWVFLFWFLET